ncbi:SUKH-3 domain-containing protein [Streptomyces caatingaensis]|uniref:SUKH-3 domain-containing protein n=1 Tax=Streptomyces caatingaensis TaxID=1678637 RepID=UPI0006727C87|nr:SUKH-3 domain-containing protein [Streptomyces caatingaensis]
MGLEVSKVPIEAWLVEQGWVPGRDIGKRAQALIGERVAVRARQGWPLRPLASATRFVRSFGLLELQYPDAPEIRWIVDPAFGYGGDAAEFAEFATDLGHPLFPVDGETSEGGVVLMDDLGRCFYQHWSGRYFLGDDHLAAFASGYGAPSCRMRRTSTSDWSPDVSTAPGRPSPRAVLV